MQKLSFQCSRGQGNRRVDATPRGFWGGGPRAGGPGPRDEAWERLVIERS